MHRVLKNIHQVFRSGDRMRELLHRQFPELIEWRAAIMKWCISWKIWLFWLPGTWLGSFVVESASHRESISLVAGLTASLIGELAGGFVLWLAASTWLRGRFVRPVPSALLLATWFASGVATYLATDAFLTATSSAEELDAPAILIAFSTSVMSRWFVSVGVLAGFEVLRSRRLDARRALETERELLGGLQSYAEAIDSEQRSFINRILEPRINSLRLEIDSLLSTGSSRPESLAHVQAIATEASLKARALSHAIASMDWSPAQPATSPIPLKPPSEWAAEFFGYLPRIMPITLWLVFAQLTLASTGGDFSAVVVLMFCQTVLITGLLAFGHLAKRLMGSAPWSLHQAMTHALFAIALIATWKLSASIASIFDLPNPSTFPLTWTLRMGAVLMGASLLCFIIVMNKEVTSELTARKAHIRALRFESEQLVVTARERYAALLHGPIQGRLALASLLLTELGADNTSQSAAPLSQKVRLTQLLDSVHDELTSPTRNKDNAQSLGEFFDNTRQLWLGLVDLDWSVTDKALKRIAEHPRVTRNLIQLCDEGINNAKKHGRARRIHIVIDFPDESTNVVVRILNDGLAPASNVGSGLGNHMYSSLTLDWSLRPIELAESGFTTELTLTVIATPPAQPTGFSRPPSRASRGSADLVTSGV